MDPDANLQEQEQILTAKYPIMAPLSETSRSVAMARLKELREALWGWLHRHGREPQWSKCPKAARHYKSYGGSNVAGWT